MEKIPTFNIGDRVRIMQTDSMVAKNLANKKGYIIRTYGYTNDNNERSQKCHVQLYSGGVEIVDASELMLD